MCHTHLQVDPETDARIASVLDAAVASARAAAQGDDVEFDHLKADALVGLITGARTTGHRTPDLTLLTDSRTMRDGPHEDTVCETGDGQPLPVETVRRLGCDATITPITLDEDGVPLNMGRTRRLATVEQRRALRAMYRSCGFPGCQVRFEDCRIHHVTWWEHLGATNLDNLLPMCERHHHHVHEGGWTLTLKPDRTITLRRPDGTLHHEGPTTTHGTEARATTTTLRHGQRRALRAMYRSCAFPGCHGAVRGLPDPSRHVVGTPRRHEPRQSAADVRATRPPPASAA